ncbi:hypothetical protein DWW00_07405 [Bacteroides fragilis]|uniref:Uncharacterized protein n=1 Tax=Bacteroides fragilis TaxID=817 RepID=A0A412Y267_BACFG|nr:hypothetical protein DWW08_15240 [Bacteroides fragilis]RGV88484.1 hypothetical protein DWW00_07405 [Bacteroides fragilis]
MCAKSNDNIVFANSPFLPELQTGGGRGGRTVLLMTESRGFERLEPGFGGKRRLVFRKRRKHFFQKTVTFSENAYMFSKYLYMFFLITPIVPESGLRSV